MSLNKLNNELMAENKKVLQKEVTTVKDLVKYWTYYLGETVNGLASNEARTNAEVQLALVEEFGKDEFPNWVKEVFIKEENKTLLEETLRDSKDIVVDEMPIQAMVMVFIDHLVDRPITEHEWEEFNKLKVVIQQEKGKEGMCKENKIKEETMDTNEEFEKETESVKEEEMKEEKTTEVKEENKEKMSTWKKVAIGVTVVAAVAGAAWFFSKED